MRKMKLLIFALLTALSVTAGMGALLAGAEHVVAQRGKEFSVSFLTIKAGDTVTFPNEDPIFHNIYSLSATKIFDLGSYKKGETRKVTFDKPGTVDVRCAIHPKMKLTIKVEP